MKLRHFDTLRPLCPVCRSSGAGDFPIRLSQVEREVAEHILEGTLHCSNDNCLREFPILDGIPLIIANLRQYVSDNLQAITNRSDLAERTESLLADCCGPGATFGVTRQHLSSYAWDHYGNLDPQEAAAPTHPGSTQANLATGLQMAGTWPPGAVIDVGCSVGRGAFELAGRVADLVLGVDLNYPMLRMAATALREGIVRYPRRRVGLVYDRREFRAHFAHAERVDFWACDITALPFTAGTFSLAANMNVLDCVYAPRQLLNSVAQVLKTGGKAIFTSPYDWSPNATPLEAWLGGHSQRSPNAGSSEAMLRLLLTPGAHPGSIPNLRLVAELDRLPWQVRLHDRSVMEYQSHLVVAERIA